MLCPFIFKGRLCGYTGPYTVCDRSVACCAALNNVANYGGGPSAHMPTIQERVVALGLLVHTEFDCGMWMAHDDRTYDGAPWQLGMGRTETTAILDLLTQIENQREEESRREEVRG